MESIIFFGSLSGIIALVVARYSWLAAKKELHTKETTPYYRAYMHFQREVASMFMAAGARIRGYIANKKHKVHGSVVERAAAFVHKHGIHGREFHINAEHQKAASQYLKDVTKRKKELEKKK